MKYLAIFSLLFIIGCSQSSTTIDDSSSNDTTQSSSNNEGSSSNENSSNISSRDIPKISDAKKEAYIEAVNSARADEQNCGGTVYKSTSPLKWSNALYKSSYEHAQDMDKNSMLEHDGSGKSSDWTAKDLGLNRGSEFDERVIHNGYKHLTKVSENIARGSSLNTAQKVVDAWLKSPSHCATLMDPKVKDFGMAKVGDYWSQDFASQ